MGSRISLHGEPARDCNQVAAAKLQTMKLLFPSLLLFLGVLGAFADPPLPAEGEEGSHSPPYYALANYLQQQKRAQASALERELLAEYLANQMGSPDYPEPVRSCTMSTSKIRNSTTSNWQLITFASDQCGPNQ